jgi:hypothetical protein
MKTIKTSQSGEELLAIHPSSSSEESRGLPSWNAFLERFYARKVVRVDGVEKWA